MIDYLRQLDGRKRLGVELWVLQKDCELIDAARRCDLFVVDTRSFLFFFGAS